MGAEAYVGPYTRLENEAELEPRSAIQFGGIRPRELWGGIPAQYRSPIETLSPSMAERRGDAP